MRNDAPFRHCGGVELFPERRTTGNQFVKGMHV
jgi:hypothetical protein